MENIENIEVHSAKLPGKFDFWRIVGKVYKNFWTRQIVGFSSIWYLLFIFGVAKDFYTHIITFTNPVSLFALYLMVNLFFCLLMFYSRLSIATQICSFLLHPCILVLFIMTDFSNYFAILPPLIVSTFILCFSKANETTKTVFFTLYAVMFVCAVIGFKVMAIFKITVPLMPPDYSMRSDDYLYSPDRHYRIVMYIDPPETENRTAMYYIEDATKDFDKNYMHGVNTFNAMSLNTLRYSELSKPDVHWISNTLVYVDGREWDVNKGAGSLDYNATETTASTTMNPLNPNNTSAPPTTTNAAEEYLPEADEENLDPDGV